MTIKLEITKPDVTMDNLNDILQIIIPIQSNKFLMKKITFLTDAISI